MAKAKAKSKPKQAAKKPVKKLAPKAAKKPVKKPAPLKKVSKTITKTISKTANKPAAKPANKPAKKAPALKQFKPIAAKISSKSNNVTKVSKTVTPSKSSAKNTAPKKVKLAEGYKPTEKEEYMSAEQLEYFRQKLLAWRLELSTELAETMDNLKEENWQESDITDRATVEIDTGLELRTRDRYRKLINKIDAAISRIDRGEYGYCEESGEEIGIKRLQARPIATLSIEAQERHERDERTHYDEDLEDRM
jgi:DnaK suppressor protein